MAVEKEQVTFSVVVDWITKLALPIILAVMTWTGSKLLDYEVRLTKLEATQYTAADAKIVFDSLSSDLKNIQKDVTTLNTKIDTQAPPQWLLDRISFLEKEVDKLKNEKP